MEFLDKLTKKASKTYQTTKEKTVKFSEELKLKGKINEAKNNITALYEKIGEQIYNQYKTGSEEGQEEIKTKCEEISKKYDEIAKLETDILSLKEAKKCQQCGSEIGQKDDFCPKCGKEQPKQEKVEVKEESEIQDVQDADVTEIKDVSENEQ